MRMPAIVLAALLFAPIAKADNIPSFALTQGVIFSTTVSGGNQPQEIDWFLTGPKNVSVEGFSSGIPICTDVLAGQTCSPNTSTQPFEIFDAISVSFGGNFYSNQWALGDGIIVEGNEFVLPIPSQGQTTFSLTIPVIFHGTFEACPSAAQEFFSGGCNGPSIASFHANGVGTAFLQFDLLNAPNNEGIPVSWTLTNATYRLSPVPEPASVILFGTGAFGLLGTLRKRTPRNLK